MMDSREVKKAVISLLVVCMLTVVIVSSFDFQTVIAQSPQLIQGWFYAGGAGRLVSVDTNGRVNVNASVTPSGTSDVNIIQYGGVATTLGQKVMASSIPVVIASDQSSLTVQGGAASGAALSGNPLRVGLSDGTNARNWLTISALNALANAGTGIGAAALGVYNGSTYDIRRYCTNTAAINATGSGNTQIVALSGSTVIYVCSLSLASDAAVDIKFTQGTGANCGSGTGDITGVYQEVTTMVLGFDNAGFHNTAANALCINLGTAANVGGSIQYAQF